jgi:hypothetical protein
MQLALHPETTDPKESDDPNRAARSAKRRGVKELTVLMTFCLLALGCCAPGKGKKQLCIRKTLMPILRDQPLAHYALNVESVDPDYSFNSVVLAFPPVFVRPEKRKPDLSLGLRQAKIDEVNAHCCTF